MNGAELTTAEKFNKLPWSIGTNALINVFMQLTFLGSVFVLFLDALDLSKTQIGFLLSLLPYTGLLALVVAPLIARFGYKRSFITFALIRVIVTGFLLLLPWVVIQFGARLALLYLTVIVVLFSVARSMVITAYYPWAQEYIPRSIQGKYSATNNLFTTLTGFLSVTVAGFTLDLFSGLTGFLILITAGLIFGAVSVWTAGFIPGGAPVKTERTIASAFLDTIAALRDRGLVLFLAGVGLITLATVPFASFVPLFMQEQVGLSSGNVVLVQTGMMLGGLTSTYLWGWTADRYGSRPIMLSGICLYALLPIFWMLLPRHSPVSLYLALGISFLYGIADMGWIIGSGRLLFVSIVPPERKTEYTALYYACVGFFGGTSQLLAGQIIHYGSQWSGQLLIFPLDPYSGLFVLSMILAVASLFILRVVRADTQVRVGEFAGMFIHGNPLMAMSSLIGYYFARDESSLVAITERLGETRSPLTVDELLEVLTDPRFNVRFEAIVSIARTRPNPRLTRALIEVFQGTELALSNIAAWALGRVGDETAIGPLRAGLDSKYHSIRAHSARALGRLRATEVAPLLRERLAREPDRGLQMAYASALGNLGAHEATAELLAVLYQTQNEGARRELSLSLARLVGDEGHFIHLLRQARADMGTATAQALTAFKRKLKKTQASGGLFSGRIWRTRASSPTGAGPNRQTPEPAQDLFYTLETCADALARNNFEQGVQQVRQLIQLLPPGKYAPHTLAILQECSTRLAEFGTDRSEYLLLALHTLEVGWTS